MKALFLIARYLPIVMSTVAAVEQSVNAPGQTKAAVALNTIQAGARAVGQTVPEPHVQMITALIDGVVEVFNKTGVFTKSMPEPGK